MTTTIDARGGEVPSKAFFLLRLPLLPIDVILASEELEACDTASHYERAYFKILSDMRATLSLPVVRAAIRVASASLDLALEEWLSRTAWDRRHESVNAAIRYVTRMASRPTPFGLFATVSVGTFRREAATTVADQDDATLAVRVDAGVLLDLVTQLEGQESVRSTLRYSINPTLYQLGRRVRITRAFRSAGWRRHELASLTLDAGLRLVLGARGWPMALRDIERVFTAQGVAEADARTYVRELVDAQLLVSDLEPAVTGGDQTRSLLERASAHGNFAGMLAPLQDVAERLGSISGASIAVSLDRLRDVIPRADTLVGSRSEARGLQVDAHRNMRNLALPESVLNDVENAARLLATWAPLPRGLPLQSFAEKFEERFGDAEVPLLESIDPDFGVFFGADDAAPIPAPLIDALPIGKRDEPPGHSLGARDLALLDRIMTAVATDSEEIELPEAEAAGRSPVSDSALPTSLGLHGTIVSDSEEDLGQGRYELWVAALHGSPGARVLARFCAADETLTSLVRAHNRHEQALDPDRVYAEIVYSPQDRLRNIVARPVLRDYEIPIAGNSGAPRDRQIQLSDLVVAARGGKIVLRSISLGREVVPKLTNAHNWTGSSGASVYRLLCAMQDQESAPLSGWSWGALEQMSYVPRVRAGRLVLSPRRWRLRQEATKPLAHPDPYTRFRAYQDMCVRLRIPRFVRVMEGDNALLVDAMNPVLVDAFLAKVAQPREVILAEYPGDPTRTPFRSNSGRYVNEVSIPFIRRRPASHSGGKSYPAAPARAFPPGSEWIYGKFYAGAADIDQVMRILGRAIGQALRADDEVIWFFTRYTDPMWHLRVRVHAAERDRRDAIRRALDGAAARLMRERIVSRFQHDTYRPEYFRYGGQSLMRLSEVIFAADSRAAFRILQSCRSMPHRIRWLLLAISVDRLYDAFGIGLSERVKLSNTQRDFCLDMLGGDRRATLTAAARQYRGDRVELDDALRPTTSDATLLVGHKHYDIRRRELDGAIREIRARLALAAPDVFNRIVTSHVHMSANRMLISRHRATEAILHDYLGQHYKSAVARSRTGA